MFHSFDFFALVASAIAAIDKCDDAPADIISYLTDIGYPSNVAREAARIIDKDAIA